jgi:hypothetical protein
MATRRLPVIQEPAGEDAEAAARPAWRWVLVGAALLLTFWFPAAVLVGMLARNFAVSGAAVIAALLFTFALASVATGHVVARFGPLTRLFHAVLAGVLASAAVVALTLLGGGFPRLAAGLSAFLVLSALGAAGCGLGAALARRRSRAR